MNLGGNGRQGLFSAITARVDTEKAAKAPSPTAQEAPLLCALGLFL